uniref:Antimicrobial peptide n=1 Tax=Ixodes ricinus TaxID=34613 RepID=K9MWI4_IXORI|nr:antimicrobial peptide [Ixodes ricinus]
MRAVAIFIVTLLVLENCNFLMSEPLPGQAWQVPSKRPKCYSKECTKNEDCKFGSCTYCNNGLWGDNTCR